MTELRTPVTDFLYACQQLVIWLEKKPTTLVSSANVQIVLNFVKNQQLLIYYIPTLRFTTNWENLMANRNDNFNLIDYRLSDAELDAFEAWFEKEAPNATEVLTALAEKSYKTSFTYVENSSGWCISVTGKEDAKFNSKTTLTTWGDEPLEALYMAFYKVMVVFSGGTWKTKTQSRRG